jgi:sortase (surface protein transpeptidase)
MATAWSSLVGLRPPVEAQAGRLLPPRLAAPAPTSGAGTAPAVPPRSPLPSAAVGTEAPPPKKPNAEVARSTPVELRIPAIGVTGPLTTLGQDLDGTVETPNNPEQAGWFWPGPSPGQVGSAVILGHVDSTEGPAVFYGLRFLQAGDRVAVTLADGVVAQFRVTRVTTYLNEQFPARQVYAASGGASALQLVTCGGEYDAANDGYQSNVVVYTTLVGTTPATTAPAA